MVCSSFGNLENLSFSYFKLSIYSLPAIVCGYNYANGFAYALVGRIFIVLLQLLLTQVAKNACVVLSNGCLHV